MIACYSDLAITLAVRRETGVLKRLHATPLAPSSYLLGGLLGNALVVGTALGRGSPSRWGSPPTTWICPITWLPVLLGIPLGIVHLLRARSRGDQASSPTPNRPRRSPICHSSRWSLSAAPSSPCRRARGSTRLAGFFPLRHFTAIVFAGFDPREVGTGLHAGDFAVLGGWAHRCRDCAGRANLPLGAEIMSATGTTNLTAVLGPAAFGTVASSTE